MKLKAGLVAFTLICGCQSVVSQSTSAQTSARVEALIEDVEPDIIAWRRDIHQNPELSNREFRTAGLVADHLRSLGMEVKTEIAVTGVVGVLHGGRPGPVIALRADMDALPILEDTGLPFASTVTAEYGFSNTVPVMHACGHDAHTAILMGAASVLAEMKDELAGTVIFVFQPAEEGAPVGEFGGAARMLEEGIFEELRPEAMFGLHV
ncbi:MAG: amidohydrolase, partial [Hyphomonadaceae bacterium]|nr:amidohydrolase [Hyphomonadaceae bacterium]